MNTNMIRIQTLLVFSLAIQITMAPSWGDVTESGKDGFQIVLTQSTSLPRDQAFATMVNDFSKWYDVSHSYSQDAKNLSLNIQRHCMLETLPDGGYVRHMEIAFYQPGKLIRLTGGMGPLQSMGVGGAMTFAFTDPKPTAVSSSDAKQTEPHSAGAKPSESLGCTITLTYNVTGASFQNLDRLAPVVDQVLKSQLSSLKEHCDDVARQTKKSREK